MKYELNRTVPFSLWIKAALFVLLIMNCGMAFGDNSGIITTVAGNGTQGYSGDNGPAISSNLYYPSGVAVDSSGNIYIVDSSNNRIRKVDISGTITTVAGNGTQGYSGDNGPAISSNLYYPSGVAVDTSGNIYIVDNDNNRIRKVDTSGTITTVAGNGTAGYSGDKGPAISAKLYYPYGVAVDSSGNIYIADSYSNRIRKIDTLGTITTVAGTGTAGYSGDNGPAASASLFYPQGITVDLSGNIYIADTSNSRIRKENDLGTITTVAGNGTAATGYCTSSGCSYSSDFTGDNVPATSSALGNPTGVAVDSSGNIYIADIFNNRIRKVDTSGTITTVAGNGTAGYSGDNGPAASAQLNNPTGVAVDSSGNIYIADYKNSRIRKVAYNAVTSYTITASAGSGGSIAPSGITTVNSGGSQTYTITSSTGYSIASVLVDGASVGAVSTYTFSNVTVNHTISATFNANASYSISGTVNTSSGTAMSGVTITLSGTASKTTTTDSGGNYSVTGLSAGTYTITPSQSGYAFNPASISATVNAASLTGENFTGSSSGAITHTLTGPSTTTVSRGSTFGPITSTITNNYSTSKSIYLWAGVYIPSGAWEDTVYMPITLSSGQTVTNSNIMRFIPPLASTGTYYFCEYLYDTSWTEVDYKCVTFTVQ